MDVVSGGELARALAAGVAPRPDRVLGRGQDRGARCARRWRRGSGSSTWRASRSSTRSPTWRRRWGCAPRWRSASTRTWTRARTTRSATGRRGDKFGVPIGAGARGLRPRRRPAGDRGGGRGRPHRQPAHGARAVRGGLRQGRGSRAGAAGRTGTRSAGSTLGGGLGVPYARDNAPPPVPAEYGAMVRRVLGDLGCAIEIEPGRLDRRQRGDPGSPR